MERQSTDAPLDAGRIRNALGAAADARVSNIAVFSEIDSTNSWLLRHAPPGVGEMTCAVADYQRHGRGRLGRRWHLPPQAGVCLSVAWTFAAVPAQLASLTLALGVAALDALDSLGVSDVRLKWPNDLVYKHSKLGGILVERGQPCDRGCTVVAGIGLNRELPAGFGATLTDAASLPPTDLVAVAGAAVVPSRNQIIASLIEHFSAALQRFSADGLAPFIARWQSADCLKGRPVEVLQGDTRRRGRAAGISHGGGLLLAVDDGDASPLIEITSGSVDLVDGPPASIPER